MPFATPPTPYARDALEPHVSGEAVDRLVARQHAHLSALDFLRPAAGPDADGTAVPLGALDDVLRTAQGSGFHHAAEAWTLGFFLRCLAPPPGGGGELPPGPLREAIEQRYASPAALRLRFGAVAEAAGSGWTWLVRRRDGGPGIVHTAPGATPLAGEDRPLLVFGSTPGPEAVEGGAVTKHQLDAFWQVVDWRGAAARWDAPVR